jgi:hypothetical protein
MHGKVRGLEGISQSPSFEGRFGRLFRTLTGEHFSDKALQMLVKYIDADLEDDDEDGKMDMGEDEIDLEENDQIDAGYTYLGQFIDHDLTFDPASDFQKQNDPEAIIDFRSPRFDLDSIYGRGPDDQPYMYEDNGMKFLFGQILEGGYPEARDLLRIPTGKNRDRAVIGDPRNDENVIVSQLHGAFLKFHNRVYDDMVKEALTNGKSERDVKFSDVATVVRWHYQWLVLNDFLKVIVGESLVDSILPSFKLRTSLSENPPNFQIYKYQKEPFIPVEFSIAAYRFGHSMVRPFYRLNEGVKRPIFTTADDSTGLNGFDDFPNDWGINWDLFFDPGSAPRTGENRIQKAYKIDPSMVNPLKNLPPSVVHGPTSLAYRNLKRGISFGLPSGQAVACFMGIEPIRDEFLIAGKKIDEPGNKTKPISEISPEFIGRSPLWFYILAEAAHQNDGKMLGQVGGQIVAETFIGLMTGDSSSFLNLNPLWKPEKYMKNGKFGMKELIATALEKK